jgi:hypothetical protein
MPVPTDQLAEDIRESDRRLTDAINDLGRRVDANHGELSEFRSEVGRRFDAVQAEVGRRFDANQAEVGRRVDASQAEIGRRIDAVQEEFGRKLDAFREEFAAFRTEIVTSLETLRVRFESALAVAKWSIGISVPVLITLLGFTISMAWHASRLDVLVRQHDEILRAKKDVRGEVPKAVGVVPTSRLVAGDGRATGR